ncbi:hypothetical protein SAMN05216490_3539 [Mucilaginibacter mallensis]|uniref:Lipocalin-like domain-containing protein n=1 Tax=Mucilaginibacter mallensis TaxID=652787 RepID=A0A1H2AHA1_MUCMA|nr:hypothetical protein [Mucilaginibacter mallensis]SDT45363.1 hypothetical protein SAMN05216490_3539 [Mucilaginibacter mallensis]
MVRNTFVLVLAGLLLCFCACKKDSSIQVNPAPDSLKIKQTLIVGEWTLQKQTLVSYVNNVLITDTTCVASDSVHSIAKFNNDSTFKSTSNALVTSGSLPSAISASVGGTYSFSKTTFNLTPTVTGLDFSVTGTLSTGIITSLPTLTTITHTVTIISISSTSLAFHTVDIYTETYNGTSNAYEKIQNFYYSK